MLFTGRMELPAPLWERLKNCTVRAARRQVASRNKGGRPRRDDRCMVTAMWYVLRPGIPRRDLSRRFGPWSSAYPRLDDGVHLVSGPLSLPSLAEQHLAGSAAWTARTSRFIGTVPIRLAGKRGRQWDERKSALIRISPLLSTVSVG